MNHEQETDQNMPLIVPNPPLPGRKPYTPPAITAHGTIQDITRDSTIGGPSDAFGDLEEFS